MSAVRFQRPGGGHLRLSESVVATTHKHIQRHRWSAEAGGILLGRMLVEGDAVVVDEITVPGPHDHRSRFRFLRAERPAQAVVNEAWARSGGQLNYLGEWHTHPEDAPEPSGHDRADWRRLVATQIYEQQSLFFMIAGRREIRAWELPRGEATPVSLPAVEDRGREPPKALSTSDRR
jgi:integrative and conjugative element protein (TIGR02256 family)